MARILVIDDEPGICRALERYFRDAGDEVRVSSRAETALTLSEAFEPDVVILDVRLPGMNGLVALDRFRERDPTLPVIVVTAFGTMETAVQAVRRGAWDYVLKPLDLPVISEVVKRAIAGRRQADEVVIGHAAAPKPPPETHHDVGPAPVPMVGRTRRMQEVFKRIGAVSLSDIPVLFVGEGGTGKEMAARAVHAASSRAGQLFELVSCSAIPAEEIGSEVFGGRGRPGRLARADGGSLFLDEVATLPAAVQARLVRYLDGDEGVGVSADARVLAATGLDLKTAVEAGRFREDLFYRLTGTTIHLPPLRDRVADVPALVAHFLTGAEGPRGAIAKDTLRALLAYPWPGNVRELRSAVEHSLAVARGGTILPMHLPDHIREAVRKAPEEEAERVRDLVIRVLDSKGAEGRAFQAVMDCFEEPLVAEVMKRTGGNQVKASKLLGIHRTTLRTKLKKYHL